MVQWMLVKIGRYSCMINQRTYTKSMIPFDTKTHVHSLIRIYPRKVIYDHINLLGKEIQPLYFMQLPYSVLLLTLKTRRNVRHWLNYILVQMNAMPVCIILNFCRQVDKNMFAERIFFYCFLVSLLCVIELPLFAMDCTFFFSHLIMSPL